MTFTAADLTFDAAAHTYTLPDGRQVPSVTTILKSCGISTDFDALGALVGHDRLEYRRALGTAVHSDCHAWDDGALDESTVHPDARPFLDAWRVFRENSRLVPLSRERRVFDPKLFYCGTFDGVFRMVTGRLVMVDIKCGNPNASGAGFQLAGYVSAWALEHPDEIAERWAVQLTPNNGVPYRIHPYTEWRDFSKFASFVTTFHSQTDRRRFA